MFDESLPNIVLVISVSLLILSVGVFVFYVVYNEIGFSTQQIDVFSVDDPSEDVTVTLEYMPVSITLVEQYNGYEWETIPEDGYTTTGDQVTVDNEYLEG